MRIFSVAIPAENRKNQRKHKERQVYRPCQRIKKAVEDKDDGDTNCNWYVWRDPRRLGKEAERIINKRMNRDHPEYRYS